MSDQGTSYKEILKATSIFGGVQFFQILVQILRSKMIAVLLGPLGLGVLGLFNSTISFLGGVTNFGITTSAIKEIAVANNDSKPQVISEMIFLVDRLIWYTGLFGMFITLLLSPFLSKITFGTYDYTIGFVWLSFSLLLNQLTSGKLVILQGLRKLRLLAQANLYGSFTSLIIVFPIFYYFKEGAIVASILIYSLSTYFFSWYYTRGLVKIPQKYRYNNLLKDGKRILFLGFALGMSGLVSTLVSYIINVFIANYGSINQLGLYNAAIAVTTSYTGLIFSAIASDYHPRLSALSRNELVKDEVNKQAEIAIYFLGPLLLFFLIFCKQVVILLYSKEFELAIPLIRLILIGTYFKLFSWAISFTFVARGRVKLFFWNELAANFYVLSFNIAGFMLYGLKGIGFAIIASYVVYSLQVFILARNLYGFSYHKKFILLFLANIFAAVFCFLGGTLVSQNLFFILGVLVIICFSLFSLIQIKRVSDLNISSLLNRNSKA